MNPYQYPKLTGSAVLARLKRVERTVQFPQRGRLADTTGDSFRGASFRTVAAYQLDRDGNILGLKGGTIREIGGGNSPVVWGGIGGNILNQLDLQAALAALLINFADAEAVSGSGTSWTLANIPAPVASLVLVQKLAGFASVVLIAGTDYTLSGAAITTTNSLTAGDLTAWYRY